jgi:outer membrane protein
MLRFARRAYLPALVAASLMLGGALCRAQPTPPVQPTLQEAELPPPVALDAPPQPSADAPQRPLTPEEAVAIALRHQPSLAVAAAGVTDARGVTRSARAGLKPSVAVSAAYNHVDGTASGGGQLQGVSGANGYLFATSVRQLIYDFDHTRDLVRQALAAERSAGAGLTKAQADLVLRVKLAFYGYVQALRLAEVARANADSQQRHLTLAQARLTSGLGLPYDVVRARTAYTEAIYVLTAARNTASVARVSLAELLGIDPRTPIEAAEAGEPSVEFGSVNELVEQALARRPEVLQARANVEAAQFGVSAARNSNSPDVTGTAGIQRRDAEFPPNNNTVSVGVAVQWDPFDSGLTAGHVQQAQAFLDAARAGAETVRLAVIADVSQAYLDLKTALLRVGTAEAQVFNAREAVRLAEGRYRAGIGVFLDVLDAQVAVDEADTNHVIAVSDLDRAHASLAHAVGKEAAPAR